MVYNLDSLAEKLKTVKYLATISLIKTSNRYMQSS